MRRKERKKKKTPLRSEKIFDKSSFHSERYTSSEKKGRSVSAKERYKCPRRLRRADVSEG